MMEELHPEDWAPGLKSLLEGAFSPFNKKRVVVGGVFLNFCVEFFGCVGEFWDDF